MGKAGERSGWCGSGAFALALLCVASSGCAGEVLLDEPEAREIAVTSAELVRATVEYDCWISKVLTHGFVELRYTNRSREAAEWELTSLELELDTEDGPVPVPFDLVLWTSGIVVPGSSATIRHATRTVPDTPLCGTSASGLRVRVGLQGPEGATALEGEVRLTNAPQ